MADSTGRHMDCRCFAALDVVKGICHRTKEVVAGDEVGCVHREPLPRCRGCASFEVGGEALLGRCLAEPSRPHAYPDMVAVTCEWFEWRS